MNAFDTIRSLDPNQTGTSDQVFSSLRSDIELLQSYILAGRKIEAIKVLRGMTNMGLKEAKDWVEAFERRANVAEADYFVTWSDSWGDEVYAEKFTGPEIFLT